MRSTLPHPGPAELVLDMGADDLVEAVLGLEAERLRAPRIEAARPALDDLDDERIGLALDARDNAVAGDLAQRRDLLADRDRDARHGEVAPRPDALAVDRR